MPGLLFFTTNSFLDRLFMSVFQERDADKTADAIKFVWLIYFLFVTIETIPGPFLLCLAAFLFPKESLTQLLMPLNLCSPITSYKVFLVNFFHFAESV